MPARPPWGPADATPEPAHRPVPPQDAAPVDVRRLNVQIFVISFLILFLEVALIRWVSTEIRIFAYLNNLVLLACFFGMGLGCHLTGRPAHPALSVALLGTLLAAVQLPLEVHVLGRDAHLFRDIPILMSSFTDSVIPVEAAGQRVWPSALLGLGATLALFILILAIFVPLGQIMGRVLDLHPRPVPAYSVNVLASVLGAWFFPGLSFLHTPPTLWFALFLALLVGFLFWSRQGWREPVVATVLCGAIGLGSLLAPPRERPALRTLWSPYQKLELRMDVLPSRDVARGFMLQVNNVGFMPLLNLSDEFMREQHAYFANTVRRFSQYDLPYQFQPDAKTGLILGAGAGNDVAAALRAGLDRVDAVEIDPGIVELGDRFHPERPHSDPRVRMIVDDARSFMKTTDRRYDIVSFGLLDSHTLSSNYNNTRLDHYVYTRESFREVAKLLEEDGVLTVAFWVRRPWLGQRIHDLLHDLYGHPPLAFGVRDNRRYGWGGDMFVTSPDPGVLDRVLAADAPLARFVEANRLAYSTEPPGSVLPLTSDDWPYLNLETPRIPTMHWLTMIGLSLLFVGTRRVVWPKGERIDLHFFLLGAAFLLLEFQNISKTTLLFGATWLVNAYTISGILVLILLANMYVERFPVARVRSLYAMLAASIVLVWSVPLDTFNFLPHGPKSVIVSLFLNVPIFFAGVIFVQSLAKAPRRDVAFGSNLLGAAVGGLLESVSFLIGIRSLLLVVLGLYALSYLALRYGVRSRAPGPLPVEALP